MGAEAKLIVPLAKRMHYIRSIFLLSFGSQFGDAVFGCTEMCTWLCTLQCCMLYYTLRGEEAVEELLQLQPAADLPWQSTRARVSQFVLGSN